MTATLTDERMAQGQAPDPFELFATWFDEAKRNEPGDPNAMIVASVDELGLPNLRTVLLKDYDRAGFVFYTNLESAKGRELAAHPKAALLFYWKSLGRQVRIRGPVSQVDDAEADGYFASRPRLSQVGAWASDQSRPAADRSVLEARVAERDAEFTGDVPRPAHWSGLRVRPLTIEFWQAGEFRLHDRFVYDLTGEVPTVQRLFP